MNTERTQIGPYVLRRSGERDRALLAWMIEHDRHHRGNTNAEFFLRNETGRRECYALEGAADGRVRFYAVLTLVNRSLWLNVQFCATDTAAERAEVRDALTDSFGWLAKKARWMGLESVGFESESAQLTAFCRKRLGLEIVERKATSTRLILLLGHGLVAATQVEAKINEMQR